LKAASIDKLFFLSGGIEPGDEESIKTFMKEPVAQKLFSIDINSRFEIAPGVKDVKKVKQFVENLKVQRTFTEW
jgi:phosphoribosylanthranilate isomerase